MRKRRKKISPTVLEIKSEPCDHESLVESEPKTLLKIEKEEFSEDGKENINLLLTEGILGNGNPCSTDIPDSLQFHDSTFAHSIFSLEIPAAKSLYFPPNIITPDKSSFQKTQSVREIPPLLPLTPPPVTSGCDNSSLHRMRMKMKLRTDTRIHLRFCIEKPSDMPAEIWDTIIKLQLSVEDKLEEGLLRVYNENEVETKRHFSCFGCSFRAARLSQISQHLDLQRVSLVEYECKQCLFVNPSRCVLNQHMKNHQLDPDYRKSIKGGLFCTHCRYNVRCRSYHAHKELIHTPLIQAHLQDEHLIHWREWFHGK